MIYNLMKLSFIIKTLVFMACESLSSVLWYLFIQSTEAWSTCVCVCLYRVLRYLFMHMFIHSTVVLVYVCLYRVLRYLFTVFTHRTEILVYVGLYRVLRYMFLFSVFTHHWGTYLCVSVYRVLKYLFMCIYTEYWGTYFPVYKLKPRVDGPTIGKFKSG